MNRSSPLEGSESALVSLPQRHAFQWATLYPVFIVVSAFFLLWPTATSLLAEWNDEFESTTYTHGYLIAAICVWLLIRNRSQLRDLRLAPDLLACIALIGTGIVWLVAVRAGIQTAHQVLMPVMMWLAVCAGLGFKAAQGSTFPIAYLYFAIPVWGYVNALFQNLTVVAVEFLLGLSGVVAYVDGHFVHLASGVIEIANGCSGLHFVIVGLAIGALYGEVSRDPLKLRLIQVALALALAVVTNWIRVYVIIVAGYLTDMQHYLVTVDHYTFGWFVFAAAMIVYFVVVSRLPAAKADANRSIHESAVEPRSHIASVGLAIAIASLAVFPAWNMIVPVAASNAQAQDEALPEGANGWVGPRASASDWRPVFQGADTLAQGVYDSSTQQVEVFVASYAYQAQGRELVGYGNSVLSSDDAVVAIAANDSRRVKEIVSHRAEGQYLTWYGYRVGHLGTHREIIAQTWYGLASLMGPVTSSIVALRVDCRGDCDSARSVLNEFMESNGL